jgi:PadR family transcriptional regulator PadR
LALVAEVLIPIHPRRDLPSLLEPQVLGVLSVEQGSLYPALYRLEHQGWITSEWGESENNRRAKYYRLTAAGKRRLHSEAAEWNRMVSVIAGILRATPEKV